MTNQLGRDLEAHRDACDKCTLINACDGYLAITNAATALRVIREGPRGEYTRLSVQEAG